MSIVKTKVFELQIGNHKEVSLFFFLSSKKKDKDKEIKQQRDAHHG